VYNAFIYIHAGVQLVINDRVDCHPTCFEINSRKLNSVQMAVVYEAYKIVKNVFEIPKTDFLLKCNPQKA
jgi:hypothetical protein